MAHFFHFIACPSYYKVLIFIARGENVPAAVTRPPFLGVFSIASEQVSKLATILYYNILFCVCVCPTLLWV